MLIGAAVSIWLFSNQAKYVGIVLTAFPEIGDLTFEVGFVLAFGIDALLFSVLDREPGNGGLQVWSPA